MQPSDARAMWQGLEPDHAMIYFAPEGFEEYSALGLEGMGQGAVEDATDAAALAPWDHLGADACARLLELGRPLSATIIDGGGAGFLTGD